MNHQYNKELLERITIYFKKGYNIDISEESASEYLDSLAGLYESFIELLEHDKTEESE